MLDNIDDNNNNNNINNGNMCRVQSETTEIRWSDANLRALISSFYFEIYSPLKRNQA